MSKFFNALKRKSSVTLSAEFDRSFWNKFDAEFSQKPKELTVFSFFARAFTFPGFVSLATVCALVISLGIFYKSHSPSSTPILSEEMAAMTKKDMLTHIEMLKTFESLPGGLPVSDEDWGVLLPEGLPSS